MIAGKPSGVQVPNAQGRPRNEGTPNTVISAMPCRFVAVEYFDDQGRRVRDVLLEANGEYFKPPSSEMWTENLRGVRQWLTSGIQSKLEVATTALPSESNVQVIP